MSTATFEDILSQIMAIDQAIHIGVASGAIQDVMAAEQENIVSLSHIQQEILIDDEDAFRTHFSS